MQGVQVFPERPGDLFHLGVAGHRLLQEGGIWRQLDEHLLQEGGAEEVRRVGIGEAAGIGLRPVEQRRDRAGGLGDPGGLVDEVQLGHAPGRFQAVGGHGEVHQGGGLVGEIDQREVGQRLGEGAVEQAVVLHGGEVLAVDPDEVDGAALVLAGGALGQHAGDRIGGVGQLHVADHDAVIVPDPFAHPGDVGVDTFVAAPGVPVDRLALGGLDDLGPGAGFRRRGLALCASEGTGQEGGEAGGQERQERDTAAHGLGSPVFHQDLAAPRGGIWRRRPAAPARTAARGRDRAFGVSGIGRGQPTGAPGPCHPSGVDDHRAFIGWPHLVSGYAGRASDPRGITARRGR